MAASTVKNGNDRLRKGNRLRQVRQVLRLSFHKCLDQSKETGCYCVCCNKCIVHHIIFCPVNRRLISCRALGSLDTNSGGSTTLLREGSVRREYRLLFFRRLIVVDLGE